MCAEICRRFWLQGLLLTEEKLTQNYEKSLLTKSNREKEKKWKQNSDLLESWTLINFWFDMAWRL